MVLRAGYLAVALKLQEAATDLSANDVRTRLSDAINDQHRGTGTWAYYIDHFGDAESGDVIYSCNSDTFRAPYSITSTGGAAKCVIDFEAAKDVVPRTIYEEEQAEEDHYAAMEEAAVRDGLYTELPLYERFIGKSERDGAEAGSFAGKGKSFPILKPEDVMAAVRSMARAGAGNYSQATLKQRIIAIAKRKGWTKYLPKSWQGGSDERKEAIQRGPEQTSDASLSLIEAAATVDPIVLRESAAAGTVPIRLIAPGKGSTAFYPSEVLKRDGPLVFKAGTHVYANHATAAEEAARPEGDVNALAGVLAKDAEWRDSFIHPKTGKELGAGLYSEVKPFSDHANLFTEKGEFLGMSIRANGHALTEAGKPVIREGKPVLKELTSAESVDVVTRAGAGGMILTEAARAANPTTEGGANPDMDAAELKKLQESVTAQAALNAKLLERAIRGDAREEARRILKTVTLAEAAKERVVETVLSGEIPQKDGALDTVKFAEAVNAAAKREGEYVASLTNSGRVVGNGAAAPAPVDAKESERRAAEEKRLRESTVASFMAMGMPKAAAEAAANKGVA